MNKETIKYIIFFLVFFILVFSSKIEDYEKDLEFNNKSFNAKIEKIVETRGIKVYFYDYEKENYFYLSSYEGINLRVNDYLKKHGSEITILREDLKGDYVEIGKGKSIEPLKNYFSYFTGIEFN